MDLSNLSSNLPLSHPIDDDSINQINKELSNEFKIGARSIAALYRLSNTKNSLIKAKGYLNCIDDLIHLIDNGSVNDLNQLVSILHDKKSELTGTKTSICSNEEDSSKREQERSNAQQQKSTNASDISTSVQEKISDNEREDTDNEPHSSTNPISLEISENHEFGINSASPFQFPPSRAPLSLHPQASRYHHHSHSSNNRISKPSNKIKEYNLNYKLRHQHYNSQDGSDDFDDEQEHINEQDDDEMVYNDDQTHTTKRRLNDIKSLTVSGSSPSVKKLKP